MAYSFGMGDRFDEVRYRNGQASRDDATFALNNNPNVSRGPANRIPSQPALASERMNLQRRFTTNNVHNVNELPPIGQQRKQAAAGEQPELLFVNTHKLIEQKQAEYDHLKKQRAAFQSDLDAIDARARQEEDELRKLQQLQQGLSQFQALAGHQSEPTTPPEFRDTGFPSAFSKPNRFSTSSMTSPPGLGNRGSHVPSQTTSPPSERARAYQALTSEMPPNSMSGSRGNSDEESDGYNGEVLDLGSHRSAASLNRNSMPVTTRDRRNRNGIVDASSVLGHVNTSSFLFDEDDEPYGASNNRSSTSFLQMNMNDDKFPTLVRRDDDGKTRLSAMSADLESTSAQPSRPESMMSGWGQSTTRSGAKHMSMNGLDHYGSVNGDSPTYSVPSSGQQTPTKSNGSNRHSMGSRVTSFAEPKRPSLMSSPPAATIEANSGPPKLQSSWSTNDIPTIKSTQSLTGSLASMKAMASTTAEQRLHNHNASLGRIPPAVNRHSRELSLSEMKQEEQNNALRALHSSFQASAIPFGPHHTAGNTIDAVSAPVFSNPATFNQQHTFYNPGYTTPLINAMNTMNLGHQPQWNSQAQMYQPSYGQYGLPSGYAAAPMADSQARVVQQRRVQNGEENSRYTNIPLEDLSGEIYGLCKDQHGCRYLQKKLEDRKPEHIQLIFEETCKHMVELMTDPFGNYLCQKLLEYTNDEQRTALVNSAAPQMSRIALNQHGTRALQKLIEFVSTKEQIQTVICALRDQVVPLILDLNGNHVIQKCLNRLSAEDSQFIFDTVASNCIVVGTHRHGCCVIQRCIDHSTGDQRKQLVDSVIGQAYSLVQDPFGNYVVQYILDLGETSFSEPLCRKFLGYIAELSKQKFSSNVIEKCIRIAKPETKHMMIEELLNPSELEKMLRDSFANYVIQTAMDYANDEDKALLFDLARPAMPAMRHTPYGRRIAAKIQEYDSKHSSGASSVGQMTPNGGVTPSSHGSFGQFASPNYQQMPGQQMARTQGGTFDIEPLPAYAMNTTYPSAHRMSNPPLPNMGQFSGHQPVQQTFFGYNGAGYPGMNNPGMNNNY